MKKWIIRVLIVLVVLMVLAGLAVRFFLDAGIKRGIETVGPMLTKVSLRLDSVNVGLLSGAGSIKGLVLGNPEGYKSPASIQVGSASLALSPGSLLTDKVVIRSLKVQAPEITLETNLKESNLGKILANVEAAAGMGGTNAAPSSGEAKASKKLQLDEFVISGAKAHVLISTLGGQSATVTLPEIRLSNLGQGPEGITAAELTRLALNELQKAAVQAASAELPDIKKAAGDLTRQATQSALDKATKGLTDFLKKK